MSSSSAPAGLYALKPWYTRRLSRALSWAVARDVPPDAVTAAGVVAAGAAAAAVALSGTWPVLGWAVPALLAARLAGANLDGALARERDVERPVGAVLNEVGDRASDLLVMAAVALVAPAGLALVALAAAMLPTFASLAVAAAGGPRANGGPLGKTERCVLVAVGAVVPALWPAVLALLTIGSVVTAAVRLVTGCRALAAVGAGR
ncbi:CDP-alcohol phosphatidyltransferase family protein [Motilibacter deserti]|uniref:CDP-alcohol phosphatidyltransferase family protein n=1 Tax=Motilibacter deserti TaxID=2714956 RepID=A0ABX0GTP0_9ACTN|nr:CDP-alcohol phosphatidyltransferase family protein [Motilibacter deserti]NHC14261.1 CDP-alcohol phosphatidyltransferase family protein [Motilibacter deserti]